MCGMIVWMKIGINVRERGQGRLKNEKMNVDGWWLVVGVEG